MTQQPNCDVQVTAQEAALAKGATPMSSFPIHRRQRLRAFRILAPAGSWVHQAMPQPYNNVRHSVYSLGQRVVKACDRDTAVYLADIHNEMPALLDALDAADAEVLSLEAPCGSELVQRQAEIEARVREQEKVSRLLGGLTEAQKKNLLLLAADIDFLRRENQRQEARIRDLTTGVRSLVEDQDALKLQRSELRGALMGFTMLLEQIYRAEKRATMILESTEVVYGD